MSALTSAGVITRLEPDAFAELASRQAAPLVVHAVGGLFTTKHKYMLGYKGLVFVTTSPNELPLPPAAELIEARSITAMV